MTITQIAFFKNDIAATIADAEKKGMGAAEVEHRVQFVWKISVSDFLAATSN